MKSYVYRAIVTGVLAFTANSARANLIVDGSFEDPVVTPGNYQAFATGATIGGSGGWTVIGPNVSSAVLVLTAGYFGPSQDLLNWADLTGESNVNGTGVQQVVSTANGTLYDLSFWVGNTTNFTNSSPSTVNFLLNGNQTLAAQNTLATGPLNWKQFTYQFTATSALTTLAFVNGDPTGDFNNGLDNVELNAHTTSAVPEPGTVGLMGLAFAGVLFARKRFPKIS